jgi:hypothetical protein
MQPVLNRGQIVPLSDVCLSRTYFLVILFGNGRMGTATFPTAFRQSGPPLFRHTFRTPARATASQSPKSSGQGCLMPDQ